MKSTKTAKLPGVGDSFVVNTREAEDAGGSAVHKAIAALEVVAASGSPLSLSEITAQLGVPKASVHRLLGQLEQNQLLRRDLTGKRYFVGDRAIRLSYTTLRSAARTSNEIVLKGLVDSIGETCNLGILDGAEVLYVGRVECNWPLRSHFAAGSRVPLHCTSLGKLLLAFSPVGDRARILESMVLKRYTANTIVSRSKLLSHLDRIRVEGFAQNDEEFTDGVIGLAVPVMGPDDRVLAGLSLHAPLARLTLRQAKGHLPAMFEGAKRLAALVA